MCPWTHTQVNDANCATPYLRRVPIQFHRSVTSLFFTCSALHTHLLDEVGPTWKLWMRDSHSPSLSFTYLWLQCQHFSKKRLLKLGNPTQWLFKKNTTPLVKTSTKEMFIIAFQFPWLLEGHHNLMGQIRTTPNTHPSYSFWLVTPSGNDHRRQTGRDHETWSGRLRGPRQQLAQQMACQGTAGRPWSVQKLEGEGKTGIIAVAQVVMGVESRFCQEVLVCSDLGAAQDPKVLI